MNLNDFNQSKYLAGKDLPEGGLDLTIASFSVVQLQDGTSKPAVKFTTLEKPMLLNKTNRKRLEMLFSTSQTVAMLGQRVGVFFDRMVQGPNGDLVGGLRLRPAGQGITQPSGSPQHAPGHQPNPTPQAWLGNPPIGPGMPAQAAPAPTGNWTDEVPF